MFDSGFAPFCPVSFSMRNGGQALMAACSASPSSLSGLGWSVNWFSYVFAVVLCDEWALTLVPELLLYIDLAFCILSWVLLFLGWSGSFITDDWFFKTLASPPPTSGGFCPVFLASLNAFIFSSWALNCSIFSRSSAVLLSSSAWKSEGASGPVDYRWTWVRICYILLPLAGLVGSCGFWWIYLSLASLSSMLRFASSWFFYLSICLRWKDVRGWAPPIGVYAAKLLGAGTLPDIIIKFAPPFSVMSMFLLPYPAPSGWAGSEFLLAELKKDEWVVWYLLLPL